MANFLESMTGGLLGSSGPNYGKAAVKSEKRRQALIDNGMSLIGSVFGGGTAPLYTPVTDKFSKLGWRDGGKQGTFYTIDNKKGFQLYRAPKLKQPSVGDKMLTAATDGSLLTIPGSIKSFMGLFGNDTPSPRDLTNQRIKKGNLFTAENQTFEGYDDNFYQQRADAYTNYAMPELQKQYKNTFDSLMYGLANRGMLNSSVRNKAESDLNVASGQGAQQIADSARGQSQQLRNSMDQARQNAIQMLYQTADPSQALQSAISTSNAAAVPSQFTPLANMFSGIANQYYMGQVLNNYRNGGAPLGVNYSAPGTASPLPDNR